MIDLRQAGVDDAAELSRIQVDSWQAYESIFSPAYMAQHNTFERRFLYWMNVLLRGDGRTYLIEDDGQSIGYVTISYPRDEDLPSGTLELTSLYIRTAETGKGYGSYVLLSIATAASPPTALKCPCPSRAPFWKPACHGSCEPQNRADIRLPALQKERPAFCRALLFVFSIGCEGPQPLFQRLKASATAQYRPAQPARC